MLDTGLFEGIVAICKLVLNAQIILHLVFLGAHDGRWACDDLYYDVCGRELIVRKGKCGIIYDMERSILMHG